MLKDFKELFREFLGRRTDEFYGLYNNNNDYLKVEKKIDSLYKKIEKTLDKKQSDMVNIYEDQINFERALTEDLIYEQGVKDGFKGIKTDYTNLTNNEIEEEKKITLGKEEILKNILDDEQLLIFKKYSKANADEETIICDIIYKQGIEDGQSLRNDILGDIKVAL